MIFNIRLAAHVRSRCRAANLKGALVSLVCAIVADDLLGIIVGHNGAAHHLT